MWLHVRSGCLAFLFVLNSLSAAIADECNILFATQILEARISSMRESVPRGDPGAQLQPLLRQLISGAAALDRSDYRDQDLAFAVNSYKNSIADISQTDFTRPVAVAHMLVGPRHRVLLRRMIILANDNCVGETGGGTGFGSVSGVAFDWITAGYAGFALIVAASTSIYFAFHFANKRKAQKLRHLCRISVKISLPQGGFASTMLDISALGAKIAKQERGDLTGPVKLTIGKTSLIASIQWQNAHFFGVLFHRALPLNQVQPLIDAKYEPVAAKEAIN